mmetsp:Transcript_17035/g.37491  ORF Transcript_17035/g.37491 Transcript_17035/m.37491 type:complete len:466 (+) Transcript_17035:87-1484(+)
MWSSGPSSMVSRWAPPLQTVDNFCVPFGDPHAVPQVQDIDMRHLDMSLSDQLGEGSFCTVHRAILRTQSDRISVAVKMPKPNSASWLSDLRSEVSALACVTIHPNLVYLIGVTNSHLLVMSLALGVSAEEIMFGQAPFVQLPVDRALNLCVQLAGAVCHLHGLESPVVHRDIKAANVVINQASEPWHLTLVDFSLAVALAEVDPAQPPSVTGSRSYLPPEALRGAPPTREGDVWSLGCTFIELTCAIRPFANARKEAELIGLHQARQSPFPHIPARCPPQLARLVRRTTSPERQDRPTANEVMKLVLSLNKQQSLLTAPGTVATQPSRGFLSRYDSLHVAVDDEEVARLNQQSIAGSVASDRSAGSPHAARRRPPPMCVDALVVLGAAVQDWARALWFCSQGSLLCLGLPPWSALPDPVGPSEFVAHPHALRYEPSKNAHKAASSCCLGIRRLRQHMRRCGDLVR